MSKFRALQRLDEPWLIAKNLLGSIRSTIEGLDPEIVSEPLGHAPVENINGIALVTLKGTMVKHPTAIEQVFLGAVDTAEFQRQCEEAEKDESVMGVLLDIDSGGGSVQGVMEASDAVRNLHAKKPVVAFTDGMMASAAYWVGSQATDIVGSPSSRVGSIGVYIPHADYSKAYEKEGIKMEVISNKDGVHKGAGLEGTTLTSEQKEQIQAEVEEIFTLFKSAIQQTRNVDEVTMQGQAFMGQSARDNNLIDAVGGFEDALRLLDYEIKNRQGVDKASLST